MPKWKSEGRGKMIPLNKAAKKIYELTSVAIYTLKKAKGLYDRMLREYDQAKEIYEDAQKQLKNAKEKYTSILDKDVPKIKKEKK